MNKNLKIFLIVFLFILVFVTSFFITYLIINHYQEDKLITTAYEIFSNNNVQDKLENTNDLSIQIDGDDVVGIIKIDKINFEGLVYEGTSLDVLKKGVGHFESSPTTRGNICLAAHNTPKYWENLHTLTNGDNITYTNILGTKIYTVFNIKQIEETDLNCLQNTQDNILTLITCVKNNPSKRLCVQAIGGD